MAYKSQTVSQYAGFGNDKPQSLSEYYFGKGVLNDGEGLRFGAFFSDFFTSTDIPALGNPNKIQRGRGRSLSGDSEGNYTFFGNTGNNIILQSFGGVSTPEVIYRVMGQNWFGAGMRVDQKKRLLYAGWQYLGKHDPSVANHQAGTVALTNGSPNVVGTGTTFVSGDVGKMFRVIGENGTTDFYTISAFTDATHITLSGNYGGVTGSGKSYTIYRAWLDTWKDFGNSLSTMNDGTSFISPTEVYEDTVLFGRKNNICTLNVTTDTITDDASPAFAMPAGYDNIAISANTNGILLGFNFQGKGTLVLWDNYSDRSIAPWIPLDDQLLAVVRYSSGWLVITTKTIFFTNGYSIEPFIVEFMDSSVTTWSGVTQDGTIVIGDYLYFGFTGGFSKTRGGVYRINLKTKLAEYLGNSTDTISSASVGALFYAPDFNRIYLSDSSRVSILALSSISSTKNYYYISNNVGVGEAPKIAEAVRVPIEIPNYTNDRRAITFSLECRVNNLDRQLLNFFQAKSNGTTTTIVVDETLFPPAQVGDLVECHTGNNKGLLRSITAISGGGTATATYTLDSALTSASATNDNFTWSGFKPVEKKVVTAASMLFDLYFGIKNKYRGKHFKVMFILTGATTPIKILPFEFQYDDMGALE